MFALWRWRVIVDIDVPTLATRITRRLGKGEASKKQQGMSFTLSTERWFAFQMLPGYAGGYAPFFAPIHVRRIQPLKTGRGELKIDYFNPFYAEGAQMFQNVRLKVLLRADHYLMARLLESPGSGGQRAAVIGSVGFPWLCASTVVKPPSGAFVPAKWPLVTWTLSLVPK